MNANKFKNYISFLDSERFGFPVAKFDKMPDDISGFVKMLSKNNVKLCIAKVPLVNMENLNTLETYGFAIKDIQVTYKYNIDDKLPSFTFDNETGIRDAKLSDKKSLEELAKNSFSNYGHYAADTRLPIKEIGEIYKEWARRSLEMKEVADKIIVAETEGQIVGFLTFKIHTEGKIKYAAGGLGCVHSKYRGRNIFPLLVLEGLKWGQSQGLAWEEHNVLINNYPVNNSFVKLGFKIHKSHATMHMWL